MARKLDDEGEGGGAQSAITSQQLRDSFESILSHKRDAKEASGLAGQETKELGEKTGHSSKIIGAGLKAFELNNIDPGKRIDFITGVLAIWDLLGYLDPDLLGQSPIDLAKKKTRDAKPEREAKPEGNGAETLKEGIRPLSDEEKAADAEGGNRRRRKEPPQPTVN